MIVPYPIVPADEGGRRRAVSLIKHLAVEHTVVLLTPRSSAYEGCDLPATMYQTTPAGRRHQIVSPGFLRRAFAIIRDERPDVILIEYAWSGLHGALLARRFGLPLILDAPNVEGDRYRSTGTRFWRAIAAYESLVTRVATQIFVVSEDDRRRFIATGVRATKLQVVPNGVDPDAMHPDAAARAAVRSELGIAAGTVLHLFFGQLDYGPNRDALAVIARELIPRLDAQDRPYELVVTGKGDIERLRSTYRHARLRFVGAVPSIASYINAADDVLVPITSGGGTRLKVLESIACGAPVVSTSIGAEGIDRSVCGDLLSIADDWEAFVARLPGNPSLESSRAVPAGFLDMYSWANIVRRIDWRLPAAR